MITREQREQLSIGAQLRRDAGRFCRAWDAYFSALAMGTEMDWSMWGELEAAQRLLLEKADALPKAEREVRQAACREEMAERARARHRRTR